MDKKLTKGQRAQIRLQILRTAKNNPGFEKILMERMGKQKLNENMTKEELKSL